jgi:hypothetical protein
MKNAIKISPVWTKDLVARRAIEFVQFRNALVMIQARFFL